MAFSGVISEATEIYKQVIINIGLQMYKKKFIYLHIIVMQSSGRFLAPPGITRAKTFNNLHNYSVPNH